MSLFKDTKGENTNKYMISDLGLLEDTSKISAPILEFLETHSVSKVTYAKDRSLLDHLISTYNLLLSWGNVETICLAGLFHSIYGTERFIYQCLSFEARDQVRALIGDESEHYAYLFCACDRKDLYSNIDKLNNGTNRIDFYDRFHEENYPITLKEFSILLEINTANNLESLDRLKERSIEYKIQMVHYWTKMRPFISKPAYQYFLKAFKLHSV